MFERERNCWIRRTIWFCCEHIFFLTVNVSEVQEVCISLVEMMVQAQVLVLTHRPKLWYWKKNHSGYSDICIFCAAAIQSAFIGCILIYVCVFFKRIRDILLVSLIVCSACFSWIFVCVTKHSVFFFSLILWMTDMLKL